MLGLVLLLDLEHNTPIALALDGACLVGYGITLILLQRARTTNCAATLLSAYWR